MSDPTWLSYAGAITGAIGAVTGISGSVMGYVSLRRSGQMKALDLRLQLRKDVNELRNIIGVLAPSMASADQSRKAVLSARGMFQSSIKDQWSKELESDSAVLQVLMESVPDGDASFDALTPVELEAKLIEVHNTHTSAARLHDKYRATLASDDRDREHIRAAAHQRH